MKPHRNEPRISRKSSRNEDNFLSPNNLAASFDLGEFSPREEKGKMAEEGKVNTHLLCDIPRDEGKGGRYAGTGWPWPRGESRGKSGFHGNRNPHLEDDLVVRRIDLFNHLAAVIEWCMPTIHHFFIQRKYRSTLKPPPTGDGCTNSFLRDYVSRRREGLSELPY